MCRGVRAVGLVLGFAAVLALGACSSSDGGSTPAPVPAASASAESRWDAVPTRLTDSERAEVFDAAWQAVNDEYFDPTFGGKDWQAIGERHRSLLAAIDDDATFWRMLNEMLFELGVSHLAAVPAELANEFERTSAATGTLGLDVRLLDGQVVVTRVSEDSPGARAGLRPGFVITSIDGRTAAALAAEQLPVPPDNERHARARQAQGVRDRLFGDSGAEVVLGYVDAGGSPQRVELARAPRSADDCSRVDPALPQMCAEVEARRLPSGSGYLRIGAFIPSALDRVERALDDLADTPSLIIDLRGNPGGVFEVRKAIASRLVGEPVLFMRYQLRAGTEEAYLDPVPDAYAGRIVILVDELSASSAEEFSGSLQSMGRATIVGAQTPGRCLVANVVDLPHDAVLMYPYGQSQTPDGRVLEGNGVIPDHPVALDRQQLLDGVDAQLEAAIQLAG